MSEPPINFKIITADVVAKRMLFEKWAFIYFTRKDKLLGLPAERNVTATAVLHYLHAIIMCPKVRDF